MSPMSALSLLVLAVAYVVLIPGEDGRGGGELLPGVLGGVLLEAGSRCFFLVFSGSLAVLLSIFAMLSASRVSRSFPLILGMTCLGRLRGLPAASLLVRGLLGWGRRWVARARPLTPSGTFFFLVLT